MKLYTEEQVRKIIHRASLNRHLTYGDVLDDITPIELPSDEEIEETFTFYPQIIEGAKWMKEQILNQNGKNYGLDDEARQILDNF